LDLLLAIITRTELNDANIDAAKKVVEREDGGHYSHLQRLLDRQDLGHTASNQLAVELGLKCAERAEVDHLTREQLQMLRKRWYAPNNMTLIVVGELDKLLPAYLERTYGELDPVDPTEHLPLPEIQHTALDHRELIHGWVGDGAKLHWLLPEPVLDDQHDETYDLLKDYLDWALYRQLRLKHGLSYGPHSEREVLGGVGFLSLNADLERDKLPEAEQAMRDLTAQLLKEGLDPVTFARLQQAAIARQAWAVQGNSALADYYWAAAADYDKGRFSDPVKRIKAVNLDGANQAMRQVLQQPGYWRIEKPLFSYDMLNWLGAGVLGLLAFVLIGVRVYRKRIA
ncbi:MAG: insulinase family protein, partial [Pseudomonas sp.]|uniref:insulinase family protein n=1 Tax=Pseudomonas sp. TaxID=306 RepID=UPI0039192D2D